MIFYFSATGNSLYVAKRLSDKLKTKCISMAEVINTHKENYLFHVEENEEIGFVIPVYFCGLPTIVDEFLSSVKFDNLNDNYIFLVQTYGAMNGNAATLFQEELTKYNLTLKAAFSVCTVDNYIPMFDIPKEKEELDKILQKVDEQLIKVCTSVTSHEINNIMNKQGIMNTLLTKLMQRKHKNGSETALFSVEETCIGCGLCTNVCPKGVIEIRDGKPIWKTENCTLCLGCLHRCPRKAIEYGKKTKGKGRYKNPYVSFPDKYL